MAAIPGLISEAINNVIHGSQKPLIIMWGVNVMSLVSTNINLPKDAVQAAGFSEIFVGTLGSAVRLKFGPSEHCAYRTACRSLATPRLSGCTT
jgi:hypothetical protein